MTRDQLRFTRDGRPASDFEAERKICDLSIEAHRLISEVTANGLHHA